MPKVFISHSSADQKVARIFHGLIEALGYEAWIDTKRIALAQEWQPSLVSGLEGTDWLLVLVSRKSAKSDWVVQETRWAVEHLPSRVIPIVLDDAKAADIDPKLAKLQYGKLNLGSMGTRADFTLDGWPFRDTSQFVRAWIEGVDHDDLSLIITLDIAVDLSHQFRYAEAEALDRRAFEIREKVEGSESLVVAASLQCVGADLLKQGRYSEAEKLERQAGNITLNQKNVRPKSCDTAHQVAQILSFLRNDRLQAHKVRLVSRILNRECDYDDPWVGYVAWHAAKSDVLCENHA